MSGKGFNMLHFTLKTSFIDDGLSCQTIEKLSINGVGELNTYNTNNISRTNFTGHKPTDNAGAMLECLEFINNSLRNSKNLKVHSIDFKDGYTITKGKVNFSRFVWGAL